MASDKENVAFNSNEHLIANSSKSDLNSNSREKNNSIQNPILLNNDQATKLESQSELPQTDLDPIAISPNNPSSNVKCSKAADSNHVTESEFLLMKTLYKIKKKMIVQFAQHLKGKIDARCRKYFKNPVDQQLIFSQLLQFVSDQIDEVLLSEHMQQRLTHAYEINKKRAQMDNFCVLCQMCIPTKQQALTEIQNNQTKINELFERQSVRGDECDRNEQQITQDYRSELKLTLKTMFTLCNSIQCKSFIK